MPSVAEAWELFEETINKSSSVDWHPSPKPDGPGKGGGLTVSFGGLKCDEDLPFRSEFSCFIRKDFCSMILCLIYVSCLVDVLDVSKLLRSFQTASPGFGTVIIVLIVLAWLLRLRHGTDSL